MLQQLVEESLIYIPRVSFTPESLIVLTFNENQYIKLCFKNIVCFTLICIFTLPKLMCCLNAPNYALFLAPKIKGHRAGVKPLPYILIFFYSVFLFLTSPNGFKNNLMRVLAWYNTKQWQITASFVN